MKSRVFSLLLLVCLLFPACAGEPSKPAALPFAAAKENLVALDYDAALRNLEKTIKAAPDEPDAKQAALIRVALLVSLADSSKQMAEVYGTGGKQPRAFTLQSQFNRMRNDYFGMSRVRLMNAMELVMKQRDKLGEAAMPLNLAFPEFSGTEHAAMGRVREGVWVPDADRYRAELECTRNALARTMALLVGAGDNVHKGHELFDKGGVQIDPRTYIVELSAAFYKLSGIFGPKALDDARYYRTTLEVIRDNMDVALKLLAAKSDKDLETRSKKLKADCEKELKKLG